jgi:hypothetical protein
MSLPWDDGIIVSQTRQLTERCRLSSHSNRMGLRRGPHCGQVELSLPPAIKRTRSAQIDRFVVHFQQVGQPVRFIAETPSKSAIRTSSARERAASFFISLCR